MAEKIVSVTFLNHTLNPVIVKDISGKKVKVAIGDSVEVGESAAKQLSKYKGMIDASKYQKPSSRSEALEKENADLKKEIESLKKKK